MYNGKLLYHYMCEQKDIQSTVASFYQCALPPATLFQKSLHRTLRGFYLWGNPVLSLCLYSNDPLSAVAQKAIIFCSSSTWFQRARFNYLFGSSSTLWICVIYVPQLKSSHRLFQESNIYYKINLVYNQSKKHELV